jgi:hypothetical protein
MLSSAQNNNCSGTTRVRISSATWLSAGGSRVLLVKIKRDLDRIALLKNLGLVIGHASSMSPLSEPRVDRGSSRPGGCGYPYRAAGACDGAICNPKRRSGMR